MIFYILSFLLATFGLIIGITSLKNGLSQIRKRKKVQAMSQVNEEIHRQEHIYINYSNVSEEDYKKFMLEKTDGININLLQLYDQLNRQQKQLDKQKEHLDNIQFNTSFIAIIIFLVILVRIIMMIAGVQTLSSMF